MTTAAGARTGTAGDVELLAGVALFAGLSPGRLRRIAAVGGTVLVRAGEQLFARGDPGDSLFVVRSGRVEVVVDGVVVRTLGRGGAFGELALLTGGRRTATVRARRDCELLTVHRDDVELLIAGEPAFAMALLRLLAQRQSEAGPAPKTRTCQVVALVPGQAGPASHAVERIAGLLVGELGPRLQVIRACADAAARLEAAESAGDAVLLVADRPDGDWARYCLRQADRPLLVIDPARRPPAGLVAPPGVELVVLGTTGLRRWLDALEPAAHHLVDLARPAPDVGRMARRLRGRSVGLVLSGGGARGFAHIGVLAELAEAGIRVERVGGTSMGAVVAGLAALGVAPDEMVRLARRELVDRRPFGDVTWPRHALIRGSRIRATLARIFGTARIEDQRCAMFAVSVDLVAAEKVVHRRGRLADAVALSTRLPGITPPIRVGARLHVDGGVLDNLPIEVMAAEGAGPVLAVDVAQPFDSAQPFDPGTPFDGAGTSSIRRPPPVIDTITRSMTLASGRRDGADRLLARTVITPDLGTIGLFDFRRLDELVEAGRRAARAALPALTDLIPPGVPAGGARILEAT